MKVLIATCSTGEGHNGAARAIAGYLNSLNINCEICDPLDFKSERAAARAAKIYARTIKYAPALFGTVYSLGKLYDSLPLTTPVYRANASYADKFYAHIVNGGFDCVICTHLFAMQALTAVNRKFGCHIPCYGILTDYVAIPFYRETELDGYFVSHEQVREQLVKKGLPQDRIYCSGIPVSVGISACGGRHEARNRLGIPQEKRIISVLSGGTGCGKILKLCDRLLKTFGGQAEIYAFPAKNKRLFDKLSKKFAAYENVKIVPFTTDLPLYIASSDVVLTKAGGLSSTEIAAARVPMIHVKSIYGCETANRKYFAENGAAAYCPAVKDAVKQAAKLISDPSAAQIMRERQRELIDPLAAEKITRIILDCLKEETALEFFAETSRLPEGENLSDAEMATGAAP